ncbi:MAG: metallophosphoesterase, partial [Halobacteriales archaeon]
MIGVVSDTHDDVDAAREAAEVFEERDVDVVVHCGDYVAPPIVSEFEGLELHGVLGNNDGEVLGLQRAFDSVDGVLHGRFAELEVDGVEVAVHHGESRALVDALARAGYDYVFSGHYHVREKRDVDGCTVVNPGAFHFTAPEDSRTVAVVDDDV